MAILVRKEDNAEATPRAETKTGKSSFIFRVDVVLGFIFSREQVLLGLEYQFSSIEVLQGHTELKVLSAQVRQGVGKTVLGALTWTTRGAL